MIIRSATHADIPAIVEMAKQFYPESPYPAIYGPMSESQAAGIALVAMDGHGVIDKGVMLVAEHEGALVGMLCLCADRFTFNVGLSVSQEMVFWIHPDHRGGMTAVRLLKAGEAMAKEQGVEVSRMAVLSTSPATAGALYERLGYVPTETYYAKRIQ